MASCSIDLVKEYHRLDPDGRALVRDWITKAKYLDLAILLNDPDARPGLDQALCDYRNSRMRLTPELTAYLILMAILAGAILGSLSS